MSAFQSGCGDGLCRRLLGMLLVGEAGQPVQTCGIHGGVACALGDVAPLDPHTESAPDSNAPTPQPTATTALPSTTPFLGGLAGGETIDRLLGKPSDGLLLSLVDDELFDMNA